MHGNSVKNVTHYIYTHHISLNCICVLHFIYLILDTKDEFCLYKNSAYQAHDN